MEGLIYMNREALHNIGLSPEQIFKVYAIHGVAIEKLIKELREANEEIKILANKLGQVEHIE